MKIVTLSERRANNLIAVALTAGAVVDSAKEPKGHYVSVSKQKLNVLKKALEQLKGR